MTEIGDDDDVAPWVGRDRLGREAHLGCLPGKASFNTNGNKTVAVQTNKQTKKTKKNKEKPWQGQELGRQEAMVNAPPCSGCRPGKIKMKILLPYKMGNEEAKNKRRCRPRNTKINSAKWQINKEARYKEEMM